MRVDHIQYCVDLCGESGPQYIHYCVCMYSKCSMSHFQFQNCTGGIDGGTTVYMFDLILSVSFTISFGLALIGMLVSILVNILILLVGIL